MRTVGQSRGPLVQDARDSHSIFRLRFISCVRFITMFSVLKIVVPIAALFSTTYGNPTNLLRPPPLAVDLITPQLSVNDTVPATGSAFFEQLLDHDHPELGTFSQKYWYNSQYWAGPGSPVRFRTVAAIQDLSLIVSFSGRSFYAWRNCCSRVYRIPDQ